MYKLNYYVPVDAKEKTKEALFNMHGKLNEINGLLRSRVMKIYLLSNGLVLKKVDLKNIFKLFHVF